MKKTKEEAERTRKQLMDAGLRVFGSKGYAAARLSDIASDAGVTRGAVYWHFGSKKGLMFAILREMANPYIQIAVEVLNSDIEPGPKIREMIRRVMDAIDDKKALLAHEQLAIRFMAEHPDEFEEYHGDVSGGMKVVTRLAENDAFHRRHGRYRWRLEQIVLRVAARPGFGQAKIQDFNGAIAGYTDIGGFQVAVDDALLVGRLEPGRDLGGNLAGFVDGDRAAAHAVVQPLALDQFHDQKASFRGLFQAVGRSDIGMLESGQRASFTVEARQAVSIAGKISR